MLFHKEKQKDEIWVLIYTITLGKLEEHDGDLEKVSQFGW